MKKINLVLQPNQFTSFTSYYLEEYWRRYFDISTYNPGKTYDRYATLFVFWHVNFNHTLAAKLKETGYKVALDHLWEYPTKDHNFHLIKHLDWFRLNESLWWRALGYHEYKPHKKITKRAFMPVNRVDNIRDFFFSTMGPLLDQFIWSYRGKLLPGDTNKEQDPQWQRFMNPDWYNNTFGSVVVESKQDIPWHTEKSFKPMAYYHPFLIFSAPGHLRHLHSLGFATFDNIFDESYDNISDANNRALVIFDNIHSVDIRSYDTETLRRIEHNHELFFNQSLVESTIERVIVNPLLESIESCDI